MDELLQSKGYEVENTIGEGTCSKVKRAYCSTHGRHVAIKIIDTRKGPKDFISRFLPRELQIAQKLDHKNIIKVYEVCESEDGKIGLVMELAERGDLFEHINKSGPLSESQAKDLFGQLAESVRHCHENGVTHRDLKCENTLLDKNFSLKLADFGFAKLVPPNSEELSATFCGSTAYAAPEVLKGSPHDSRKSDTWSMGVVLYVMLSGHLPFDDTNIPKMLSQQEKGISLDHLSNHSPDCKDLLLMMLTYNIQQRPFIGGICSHKWLEAD
ncbi:testis-specific serine/threonine-protein kinase 3-like [Polyodon spathula]|uniref:testis-specific serine/threonine-protein kinase 3-like n=1 Tax=Polyodon spathula TaxID=7913 RepID=UPI001B7E1369|nr:testis-specific serine/threonine-protein kinase 3-like [Polyodon spathula]